jgi:signal transduction histidine kinase
MGQQAWKRRLLLLSTTLLALILIGGTLASSVRWIDKPFPGFFLHENLTVGPYFLPGWSGGTAGLRSLDQVVAVDGKPLRQRDELYDLIKSLPAAMSFRYQVIRDRKPIEIIIPSMTLSLFDWFLSFGVYVLMGIAFLIIGVAPFYFHASSPAALPLCFMVMAVFVWFESTFDFMTTGILPKELRTFGLVFTPSAGIHLALLLKRGQPLWRAQPASLVIIYAVSLVLGVLNSATFYGPVERWIPVFRLGYLYTCIGALTFLAITGAALRGALAGLERSRLRVMFVGAVLGFLLPTLGTVLTSSFNWPIPYNLALVPTVFFPLSVAYALLQYSLFDMGNAFKVALSRIALTAFLLAVYAVMVFLLGPWVGIHAKDPLVPFFFSVLVVLIFNPVLRWIEGIVDRYIYRQEYDPAQVQEEVSLFLRSLATAPRMADGFLQRVTQRIGLETAALAYRPKDSNEYLITAAVGVDLDVASLAHTAQALSDGQLTIGYYGVSRGEVTTSPRFSKQRDVLLRSFDQCKSELLLPLVLESEFRGFISFGPKRSRKEHSAEDLDLLATLTAQLALSLENGRLYEESVKAYNQAEATNKRLIEMDRVKKQFVANICHELRTPVSTIIGYGEVLLDPNFKGDARGILERLVNNGQELSELMDNLMNFSRMEADGPLAQFEAVRLKEILAGIEMMTQRLIRQRPIRFGINIESTIDTIESDAQKLQQILIHLLTNALKFTEKGSINLTLRRVDEGNDDFLEIAVADTGIGIKREDQEIIFEDFRQLDGSSSRQYGGTGLGLGLCKKLAEALGGAIRVSSEVGVGSVFSLLLPVRSPSGPPVQPGLGQANQQLQ